MNGIATSGDHCDLSPAQNKLTKKCDGGESGTTCIQDEIHTNFCKVSAAGCNCASVLAAGNYCDTEGPDNIVVLACGAINPV